MLLGELLHIITEVTKDSYIKLDHQSNICYRTDGMVTTVRLAHKFTRKVYELAFFSSDTREQVIDIMKKFIINPQ